MTIQRCSNDMNYYCKGEPDWEIEPEQKYTTDPRNGSRVPSYKTGGKCKLNPKTCDNSVSKEESEKNIPHYTNTYKDTKTLIDKPKKGKSKQEPENLQGSLF